MQSQTQRRSDAIAYDMHGGRKDEIISTFIKAQVISVLPHEGDMVVMATYVYDLSTSTLRVLADIKDVPNCKSVEINLNLTTIASDTQLVTTSKRSF